MSKLTWDDFVGNEEAKDKLQLLAHEGEDNNHARVPDFAFIGASGHGKSTLARVLADSLDRKLLELNCTSIKDPFVLHQNVLNFYTNNKNGCIILLDEAHALSKTVQDNLLTATETPRVLQSQHKGIITSDSMPENCSFIFSTTHTGRIKSALMTRLEVITLFPYSVKDRLTIAFNYLTKVHKLSKEELTVDILKDIAKRSRNVRQLKKFCDSLIKYKKRKKLDNLTKESMDECFRILGVDKYGMTKLDRTMLSHLMRIGGTVGLETLEAVMPSATKAQIKDQIEPFLLTSGFMVRTTSGRMITTKGRQAIQDS